MPDINDESLDVFKLAYKSAASGIAVADMSGTLRHVNPAFLEMWGCEDEAEVVDRSVTEFWFDPQKANSVANEVIETGGWEGEILAERNDETTFPVHVSASRITNESGEPVYIMSSFVDISERVAREQQLRSKKEQLDDFAGVVSHDIRNPLGVAQGRVEMLQTECESDHIPSIVRSLDRIEDIVADTLTLARQGQVVSDPEPIELISIGRSCWKNISTPSATLDVADDITIIGDYSRLKHIFENLFRNAIEHGGDGVTVRVGQFAPNGIYVENDGPPIPSEKREEVFEPGHSSGGDGTGFGLTIVKRIAEAHGWQVDITEGTDGGARFEFTSVEIVTA